MSALIDRFFRGAPPALEMQFAYACADRAVRVYAVWALRNDGMYEQGKLLEALSPILGDLTAHAAAHASLAARTKALLKKPSTAETQAAEAACDNARLAAYYAYVGRPSEASSSARAAAANADFERQEIEHQERWIDRNWGSNPKNTLSRETLADLDAYIADGLLLGDDE